MVSWHTLDAHDWRQAVAARSAAEGLDAALTRVTQLNPTLNAFTLLLEDEARVAVRPPSAPWAGAWWGGTGLSSGPWPRRFRPWPTPSSGT